MFLSTLFKNSTRKNYNLIIWFVFILFDTFRYKNGLKNDNMHLIILTLYNFRIGYPITNSFILYNYIGTS